MRINNKISPQLAVTPIKHFEPFLSHSKTFEGKRVSSVPTNGSLSHKERQIFEHDLSKYGELYVVLSYRTPIAWFTEKWHINEDFISVTTSKHRNIVRKAIK